MKKAGKMIIKKVRINECINNEVMKYSEEHQLTTSETLRKILSEYFNNKQDKQVEETKKMKKNLIDLLNRNYFDINNDLIKIKNALLVIGKSSAVSSKQVREIFAKDKYVN